MSAAALGLATVSGRVFRKCEKCAGAGHIAAYAYYDEGICFSCAGKGYKGRGYASVESFLKAAERREAKEALEAEEQRAAYEANRAELERQAAEAEAARVAAFEAQQFAGEIGSYVAASGIVEEVFSFDGKFGAARCVTILSGSGRVKFFTSRKAVWSLEVGSAASVAGEVQQNEVLGNTKISVIKITELA